MAGETVSSGPYRGGLNTQSDAGMIADDELVVCQNFEVEADGSLRSRPPFASRSVSFPLPNNSGDMRLIGTYTTTAGVRFIIANNGSGTYAYNGSSWVLITSTIAASAVQQFAGLLYLLAPTGSANPGGTWDGSTFTANSNMPKGVSIVVHRGRLWVTSETDVRYSAVVVDANFWTVGGTYGGALKINGGNDGQFNVALIVAYGNILVFRNRSIWQFSYSTDPAYGQQSQLVGDIGLANSDSIVMFENIIYFIFNGNAYVLNGANASQINTSVPFRASNRFNCYLPFAVSIINRKVLFSYYDTVYVWNLRSRTWSTWTTAAWTGVGKFIEILGATTADFSTFLGHSNFSTVGTAGRTQQTLFFTDMFTTETEPVAITSIMQTKTYDYAAPNRFKRLFWWGADVIVRSQMVAVVNPVVYSARYTWGQVRTRTWGVTRDFKWGYLGTPSTARTTTITPNTASVSRLFLRFAASLRFRRINYQITVTTDGSTSQSPARVFSLETVVDMKQGVPRQVN